MPMNTITLTQLKASDSIDLLPLWGDAETVKYTYWGQVHDRAECDALLERVLARYAADSRRHGPYVIRNEQGQCVGLVGVNIIEPFQGEHEVWYLFHRQFWGQGWASRTLAALIEQLRATSAVAALSATAVTDNIASWKLLEKNGFQRRAVIPAGFDRNGLTLDLFEYVLVLDKQ